MVGRKEILHYNRPWKEADADATVTKESLSSRKQACRDSASDGEDGQGGRKEGRPTSPRDRSCHGRRSITDHRRGDQTEVSTPTTKGRGQTVQRQSLGKIEQGMIIEIDLLCWIRIIPCRSRVLVRNSRHISC